MKHLGDITKINGAEIEPVWCITGGSPCQDLSVAGKRKGLKHSDLGDGETTRSGLFMEQVRIVKEMRERDRRAGRPDELVRPRFLVWENVPGAFSSNFKDGFGDFGAVLEEIVRIAEPTFSLPRLQGKQKWTKSGALDGDGWSIAWRTHDAQYWGVPQRRRRISIVADFGGKCAGEISFECEGVRGNFAESGTPWKAVAGDATNRTGADDCAGECVGFPIGFRPENIRIYEETATTICNGTRPGFCNGVIVSYDARENGDGQTVSTLTGDHENRITDYTSVVCEPKCYGICSYESNSMKSGNPNSGIYEAETSRTLDLNGGNPSCNQGGVAVCEPVTFAGDGVTSPQNKQNPKPGVCHTLNQDSRNYLVEPNIYDMTHPCDVIRDCGHISPVLKARMGTGGNQVPITVERIIRWIVRRLTPMECERLQGYPDHWTDIGDWVDSKGKKHKGDADSPRYKALGNSIALPFWYWMFCRMAKYLPEDATLGSLFDGIGGFPACWEAIHGKGTARWASEIEEFPIAVTKMRFPEEE